MAKQKPKEERSQQCPFCKEAIKVGAIKCKHCDSTLPSKPRHGGTCPFCAERVEIKAVKCKHCKSMLLPLSAAAGQYSSVSVEKRGSMPATWETPFIQTRCIVRTYCEDGKMYSIRCCATPDGQMKCGDPQQVGNCNEGGRYEMGYYLD